jgi:pseudouridine-5'-phosphate glycosidase
VTDRTIDLSDEVAEARAAGRPIVALESTIVTHGMPYPANVETARAVEAEVRAGGAVPATIAVLDGRIRVGLDAETLERLATMDGVLKLSRADLAYALATGRPGSTTVAATMIAAHLAGIRVFATGGIGGAHRRTAASDPFDVSADLVELARTPVLVVCAGAKSILDLPQTLETLETLGVPVIGYRTDDFPAFYTRGSGGSVSCRVEAPAEAAAVFGLHVRTGGAGAILANPLSPELAIPEEEFAEALRRAEADAVTAGATGPRSTPYLLARIAELTGNKTLAANRALIVANARLAAEVAKASR